MDVNKEKQAVVEDPRLLNSTTKLTYSRRVNDFRSGKREPSLLPQ
jgi:hypothetical protein